MRVSAKVDCALRAIVELAAAAPPDAQGLVTAERLATAQTIPPKFLESILLELRHGGLVSSQRGADGGYRLGRPASEITVANVIRAVEGPIATIRGSRPEDVTYARSAVALRDVWIELRTAMRGVLEQTTIAVLVARGERLGVSANARSLVALIQTICPRILEACAKRYVDSQRDGGSVGSGLWRMQPCPGSGTRATSPGAGPRPYPFFLHG